MAMEGRISRPPVQPGAVSTEASRSRGFWEAVWRGEIGGDPHSSYALSLIDLKRIDGTRKILDVGCGKLSNFASFCVGGNYVGIDVSRAAIEGAKDNFPGHRFVIADAVRLPFRDNSFDTVICMDTLPILGNDARPALKELVRVSGDFIAFSIAVTPDGFDGGVMISQDGLRTVTFSRPVLNDMFKESGIRIDKEDQDLGRLYIEASKITRKT